MQIEEFVSRALVQVARGITQANRELRDEVKQPELNVFSLSAGQVESEGRGIEFDLAVVTRANAEGHAGTKWLLEVVGLDLKGSASSTSENTSRIRFRVSVDQWLR